MDNKQLLFIDGIGREILSYIDDLQHKPFISIDNFNPQNTVLVVVDVINGFTKEGTMASSKVAEIIPTVKVLMQNAISKGIKVLAFADCHTECSSEFDTFPSHCLDGTSESEIVDELKSIKEYTLIKKNSTNGFHAPDFQRFLKENPQVDNFIVCGDCTDICVMNFCLTLQTKFDQDNKSCEIVIPIDCVETYDAPKHYSELMNIMSLKLMENAGVNLVLSIS
ncbi:MAG: cysteine hydrolase [Ruminococcus sp.]|nr:cysteine hydrolase [Ruminococcus sp.]MCD7801200.1 cysteine hydrolase [Ruminococcus sp.]